MSDPKLTTSTRSTKPGLREVADLAGVALSTASRAMSNRPGVSPRMRERVIQAALELGYEPDLLAQSFSKGATMTVGFLVRDIASPAIPPILLGAEAVLRSGGYAMLLTNSEGLTSLDVEYIRMFRQRRVDGLVLSLADESHPETLAELERFVGPCVVVDRTLPDAVGASNVLIDHAAGLRKILDYLVELGHRRIGFVGGPERLRPTAEAARVLHEATASRRGLSVLIEAGQFAEEHGAAAAVRLLADSAPPTAIVAGNAQILLGVLRTLRERGLRVPEDLSIVSVDHVPYLDYMEPPVASISRDQYSIGRTAGELLLRRLAGGPPETVLVPTTFSPRSSCAPPNR